MRIGTWNLGGRWSSDHAHVLAELDCDLWLLTEVRPRVVLEGYHQHLTTAPMSESRHWAGISTGSTRWCPASSPPASLTVSLPVSLPVSRYQSATSRRPLTSFGVSRTQSGRGPLGQLCSARTCSGTCSSR